MNRDERYILHRLLLVIMKTSNSEAQKHASYAMSRMIDLITEKDDDNNHLPCISCGGKVKHNHNCTLRPGYGDEFAQEI